MIDPETCPPGTEVVCINDQSRSILNGATISCDLKKGATYTVSSYFFFADNKTQLGCTVRELDQKLLWHLSRFKKKEAEDNGLPESITRFITKPVEPLEEDLIKEGERG